MATPASLKLISLMNRILLLLSLFIFSHASGQDYLSMAFAQHVSKLNFKDSKGKKSDAFGFEPSFGYALNYQHVFKQGVYVRPEIAYKKYVANASISRQRLDYAFHYLDISIGMGYIYTKTRCRPYAGISVSTSALFKASQNIGVVHYDLISEKKILPVDVSIAAYAGVQYIFMERNSQNERAGVFLEAGYAHGLLQLEKDSGQKLSTQDISFRLGITFKLLTGN